MPITLYGIPNCNTIKKARDWLNTHGIDYTFHDFKKQGITPTLLSNWLNQQSHSKLINRAGLTWRGLSEDIKNNLNDSTCAIALMLDKPSVIKRPVLEKDGRILHVGFSETDYQLLFQTSD